MSLGFLTINTVILVVWEGESGFGVGACPSLHTMFFTWLAVGTDDVYPVSCEMMLYRKSTPEMENLHLKQEFIT